jgi:hypothetical protein
MLRNNIDKEFDYSTIKAIVVKSLEKIVKQEVLKNTTDSITDVVSDCEGNVNIPLASPTPLLKLKIRNTTKYLIWRIAILERDNFRCEIYHTSMKDNKSLRLEVHHAKTFDDICNENNVCTVEQALACKELWNLNNGICICYSCHKETENLRTKLRSMFFLKRIRE